MLKTPFSKELGRSHWISTNKLKRFGPLLRNAVEPYCTPATLFKFTFYHIFQYFSNDKLRNGSVIIQTGTSKEQIVNKKI